MADDPSANSPEDLGYKPGSPAPGRKRKTTVPEPRIMFSDHYRCLRAAERGEYPDTSRLQVRMAFSELRAWGFIHAERCALTPLGAQELARKRAAR